MLVAITLKPFRRDLHSAQALSQYIKSSIETSIVREISSQTV